MDLLLAAAYTNFTTAPDLVPQDLYGLRLTLGSWDLAKFSTNGVPGSTASATQELPGGDPGQPGDQQDAEPTEFGLSKARPSDPFSPVCTACPGLLGVRPEQEQLGP